MAQSPGRASALKTRVASALVLAPVVLAAVWFGSPWIDGLTVLGGARMAWEWARLCGAGEFNASGVAVLLAVTSAVGVAAFDQIGMAFALTLAGAGLVLGISLGRRDPAPHLTALGVVWLAVPCIALLWLAHDAGKSIVFWILAVVWATDIGAYFVGRTVGGPKLAPRISPKKTWSGLLGGMASAALAGTAVASLVAAPLWPVAMASGSLAVVGQAGDLAESALKRRFGVKDSSGLIPGHGGILDRVDALLTVIPAVALLRLAGAVSWR